MNGNPVIKAAFELELARKRVDKMKIAFEHENQIRDKVVKAFAAVTGISEKHLVQTPARDLGARLAAWVKDMKKRAKASVPFLEERVVELERLLAGRTNELEEWKKKAMRIKGAAYQLCADVEHGVEKIKSIECEGEAAAEKAAAEKCPKEPWSGFEAFKVWGPGEKPPPSVLEEQLKAIKPEKGEE